MRGFLEIFIYHTFAKYHTVCMVCHVGIAQDNTENQIKKQMWTYITDVSKKNSETLVIQIVQPQVM